MKAVSGHSEELLITSLAETLGLLHNAMAQYWNSAAMQLN